MAGKRFQDHFSGHAGDYASYRPGYPQTLFRFLASLCSRRALAWDCATGNGQAAAALVPYFEAVVATDASEQQIASADRLRRVEFRVAGAHNSGLANNSVDLLTVAQALHWFDMDAFFAEAGRVLRPGGVLAVWSYENCRVDRQVDDVMSRIFAEVEDYWPPERAIVASRYRHIQFPGPLLEVPLFDMREHWHLQQMLGYLRTWSATKRYQMQRGQDPVGLHEDALRRAWGDDEMAVSWPLTVCIARKADSVSD